MSLPALSHMSTESGAQLEQGKRAVLGRYWSIERESGSGEEIGGKSKDVDAKIVRREGKRVRRVEMQLEGEWAEEEGKKRYEDALGQLGEEVRGQV